MPPKRKDDSSVSSAGSTAKRTKPAFRTPTTARSGLSTVGAATSKKNRIVTLRTSASGRRGYQTQDMDSSSASPTSDNCLTPLSEAAALDSDSTSGLVTNIQTAESDDVSPAKPKLKKRNTTTVRVQLLYNDIVLNYICSQNFRTGFHIVKPAYLSYFGTMVWLAIWAMKLVLVVNNKSMPAGNV